MTSPVVRLAELVVYDRARAEAEAIRILASDKAKRSRLRAKSAPSRKSTVQIGVEQDAKHRALVEAVMRRDGQACELGAHAWAGDLDPHHLEPGTRKRKNERVSNVIRACRPCHDAYHMSAKVFVRRVKEWCARHGYPLPNRKEYR